MKITRSNVENYARNKGLEPIEEDGTPDGFLWQEPDITIKDRKHKGKKIKFKPLAEWDEGITYE